MDIKIITDDSIHLLRQMFKADNAAVPMSPLVVNTNEMQIMTLPMLDFCNFNELPNQMMLENNGRTSKQ